ncbi:hypothetical protein [Streptomyces sp. NBC_01408]|uniref:hypothetical protein n=1 Tax=Streptomyces sp. NBC_01408 TaxID=2903855 RepID=UPI00224C9B1D|nr:hypothetical protein [Streptomyces sp. NBC_01408]MCX4696258.1 hypothetical protein [Streptomyces sp. NBC_01408]
MTITPVMATLFGAVIGALATIGGQWVTQRATRARERDHKIWERRADALEETHRVTLALAARRREVASSHEYPEVLDPEYQEDQARLVTTKIALYASSELLAANRASFQAHVEWLTAVMRWSLVEVGDPKQFEAYRAAWQKVEQAKGAADAADEMLVKQLRTDALLVPRGKWRRRWRRK